MDTNATSDDDLKAIKKLGEEFFAGVNTGDLDRRMATMDAGAIIMPPDRPSIVGKIPGPERDVSVRFRSRAHASNQSRRAGQFSSSRQFLRGSQINYEITQENGRLSSLSRTR